MDMCERAPMGESAIVRALAWDDCVSSQGHQWHRSSDLCISDRVIAAVNRAEALFHTVSTTTRSVRRRPYGPYEEGNAVRARAMRAMAGASLDSTILRRIAVAVVSGTGSSRL